MKTLLIGDTHLMSRLILQKANEVILELAIKRVILMGDYTDQWAGTQFENWYKDDLRFLYRWKQDMLSQGIEVILLVGNHDVPYLVDKPVYYSVKNQKAFEWVREMLFNLELRIAYKLGNYLISHAGYTISYEPEKWHFKTLALENKEELISLHDHVGLSRGGRYMTGSPIWADLNRDLYEFYNRSHPKQIVGHTPVEGISLGQEIIGVDTFSLRTNYQPLGNGEMLLYEDEKLTIIENLDWKSKENQAQINEFFSKEPE